MSEEIAEKAPENGEEEFLELNYDQMAADQRKHVDQLQAKLRDSPSDVLADEFDRQLDKLRFLENAAQLEPRERARSAATAAKESVLRRAII